MKSLRIILIILIVAAGFRYGLWYGRREKASQPEKGRRILYYVDPMHPAYKSDKPGTAPDCGMKLEPVYEEPAGAPAGAIHVAPEQQQMIGVRYGVVEVTAGGDSIRAVGRIAQDETRVTRVHSKLEGWIEQVHIDFTGAWVQKGQPLLTLYSPEMLATEQEFLLSLRAKEILLHSSLRESGANSDTLIEAARRRLELWDLNLAQIEEIQRTGKAIRSVTLFSPATGFVLARNAFPSQRVTPETELYVIADLSHVWIMADVFEADVAKVRVGQLATVSLPYENGRSFRARINYIQPQLDPATRTMKVRLEAPNPGLRLKPEMFVDVDFRVDAQPRLTVPADAVLDAGLRKTVFVDRGDGYLEPRQVEVGDRAGDRLEIRKGLSAGERIVTSGNFLIDSESQLQAAAGGMKGHAHGDFPAAQAEPAQQAHVQKGH